MNILKLAASILVCQAAGFIGSFFTRPAIPGWYAGLEKPSFNPPNGVFAPVWTALYLLMGIALFLVWKIGFGDERVRKGMILFGIQLVLNTGWSIAFFGFESPLAGLVVIVVLWAAILATMLDFFRISRVAGALLVPYIAWVSYAAVLNLFLYTLNR
ncbi:MAG TPA: tryptophan-rich sensory protein [Candidatus Eisenbacteria bacterium]|uniref:Tryptophan-rich sensory protein n=1 Tax=Eiseniibacteriota bacterium TaxID=2212470 RepID=A0A7V2F4A7_UNCEI|nr:tryptophan-rich sensory protein [Candidatus Eisenbacteria bacterium]